MLGELSEKARTLRALLSMPTLGYAEVVTDGGKRSVNEVLIALTCHALDLNNQNEK